MQFARYLFALLSPALFSFSAHADILFSQLELDGSYVAGAAFNVSGADSSNNGQPVGYYSVGAQFTLDSDALLSSIELALTYFPQSSSHDVLIKLQGNNQSGLPDGNLIASGVVTTTVAFNTNSTLLTTFSPVGPAVQLTGGSTYWITAEPTEASTFNGWNVISRPTGQIVAHSNDGTNYYLRGERDWPAFQVTGTQVPEPSTLALFIPSALFLAQTRRRHLQSRNVIHNDRNA